MIIKVFIENEAGSDQKNLFHEKTLLYKKTVTVSRPYPYPYGFILNTTSGDGDNLDCFVITTKPLKSQEIVEVEPIGMMEQIEDGQEDHKIIAVLKNEHAEINDQLKKELADFISNVFSHLPAKTMKVGNLYGPQEAEKLIKNSYGY